MREEHSSCCVALMPCLVKYAAFKINHCETQGQICGVLCPNVKGHGYISSPSKNNELGDNQISGSNE